MASLVAADLRPVIDRYWHRDCGRELRFRLETLFRDNRSILGDDFRNPATPRSAGPRPPPQGQGEEPCRHAL